MADTGEEMLAPTQCPRCAPREQRADEGRKTEDVRPKTEDVRVKTERAVMEPARGRTQVARHQAPLTSHQSLDEEFDIRFTVRQYGHVKSWDTQKGQGTIVDDDTGEVYPVYQSGLEGGTRHLAPGQAVEFELDGNPRRPEAVLVIVL